MSYALELLLAVLLSHTLLPAARSDAAATVPVAHAGCHLDTWLDGCRRLTTAERQHVRAAVFAHVAATAEPCRLARQAVLRWLTTQSEVWLFGSHRGDHPATGRYVLAQTAHASADRPAGVAFRAAILGYDAPVIARIAIHEGAHLAGADEDAAQHAEHMCITGKAP